MGSQGAADEGAVKLRARLPRGAEQDGRDAAVRCRALRAAQRIRTPGREKHSGSGACIADGAADPADELSPGRCGRRSGSGRAMP